MKTKLLIVIGIIIAVISFFLVAYFTSISYDVERCIGDIVSKDFTGEIIHKQTCVFPFTGQKITETFIGCDDGFKQVNETCVEIKQDRLHNLNSTEREEFIMKYTDTLFNGEFNDHAYIIDLQQEYAVDQPIIFTVVTWGYGHPCQSPSFVYYYETKDPANIVFEDKFIRLCQVLEESDYTYYYSELNSYRTTKALNDNVYPVFDKPGSYIVSVDDKVEYSFSIMESESQDEAKNCPDGQTYNKTLFKCVISCEDDLVYNGYTNSCTTEFELKYYGFCNDGFTYNPSLHVCYSDVDSDYQQVPLKDPPRTPPPEPELIPKDDVQSTQEHYEIEITGMKDVYLVGEQYDFSYIISGYGNSCGSKEVTFPDQNGDTMTMATSASCIAGVPMNEFVFDVQKEYGTTYGHVKLKNPGTYTITVTFDRPSQYFPTTVSKEFRVMEK